MSLLVLVQMFLYLLVDRRSLNSAMEEVPDDVTCIMHLLWSRCSVAGRFFRYHTVIQDALDGAREMC